MAKLEINNTWIFKQTVSILGGIGAAGIVSRVSKLCKPESRYVITDLGIKVITAVAFFKGVQETYDICKGVCDAYEEKKKKTKDDDLKEEDKDDD